MKEPWGGKGLEMKWKVGEDIVKGGGGERLRRRNEGRMSFYRISSGTRILRWDVVDVIQVCWIDFGKVIEVYCRAKR